MENNYNRENPVERHELRMAQIKREATRRAHIFNIGLTVVYILILILVIKTHPLQKPAKSYPIHGLTGQVAPLQGTAPVLQPADSVQPQQATGGVASYE